MGAPFTAVEWALEWAAYFLSNWKFLEVLEYMSSLSILVAVLFYFSESGDRAKQKHYQARQVLTQSFWRPQKHERPVGTARANGAWTGPSPTTKSANVLTWPGSHSCLLQGTTSC
jgi:hypothetical protein